MNRKETLFAFIIFFLLEMYIAAIVTYSEHKKYPQFKCEVTYENGNNPK